MKVTEITKPTLLEQQVFDFDSYKQSILSWIQEVKKGNVRINYNPFYGLIVNDKSAVGDAEKLGLPKEFATAWKNYFSNPPFVTDGGPWSQFNINRSLARKSGNKTYNFYVTVARTKDNIAKFINSWRNLFIKLKEVSDKNQTPISAKTHRYLDIFATHNDSFKVYYDDLAVKDQVVNAVKEWLQQSDIQTSTRSHEHGVDIKGGTGQYGNGSYGQLLSNVVAQQVVSMIKQYPNATPEQVYEWIKKYLPHIIQSVKVS